MKLLTCLCIFVAFGSCFSWNLPDAQFINDAANYFSRVGIVYHLPVFKPADIVNFGKMSQQKLQGQSVHPSSFVKQMYSNDSMMMKMADEDLHYFTIDSSDTKQSVKDLEHLMKMRKRTNREFWLVDITELGDDITNSKMMLNDLPLDIDDDIFLCKFSNENEADVWEIYKLGPAKDLIMRNLGTWNRERGFDLTNLDKWKRRGDLTGHHFNIATLPSRPYITDMVPIGPNTFKMYGMFAEVFDNLQIIMNFTYDLTKPPDGQWGAIQPDGSWSGMVGLLSSGAIDIAATDFTVTKERSVVMTFANPITQIYHSLFIQNPSETYNFVAYIEPLHWLAWVGIFIFILFAPAILGFASKLGERDPAYHEFTFGKSYVYLLSALTMRGWSDLPSKTGAQIALYSLLVWGTLTYWHWEAMLISYLSTRVIVLPFNNIPELVANTQFRIILIPGSSYEDAFKTSKDPDWMAAWTGRVQPHLEENKGASGADLVASVLADGNTAVYDNYFSLISFKEYEDCKMIAIPAKYDFKPYAYGFQKDSPFLPLFNYYLKEMYEKGSMKQILKKYEAPPQVCPDLNGKPLGFGACFTAFGVLFFGAGFGLILFCVEAISRIIGLDIPILNMYGVGDAPAFNETNFMNILMLKDDRISALEKELLFMKKGKGNGIPVDSWN